MRALVLAALAAFFASEASAQQCVPPQLVAAQAVQRVPDARIVAMLQGDEAQGIATHYNAMPPATQHAIDGLAVIGAPNVPVVFLIGYIGACTVFADSVPLVLYNSWTGQGT